NNVEDSQKGPFWKRAVRIISTVAKLIPVDQPVLGEIGSGLDVLTNINTSDPLSTVERLGDLSTVYKTSGYQAASEDLKAFLNGDFTRRKDESALDYAGRLRDTVKKLGPAAKLINQEFKAKQIDNAEVQREFDKISAEDPQFNDLMRQVTEVN